MKILIVSNTPWDDNNSFGNSFSNIFGNNSNYEIANIYCQPGYPNTKVCNKFFQITEKGIINTILRRQINSGQEINSNGYIENNIVTLSENDQKFLNKLKIFRWQLFFWIRDIIWSTGVWKSKSLDSFILDFQPDIVFLPIYYSSYLNQIGLYAKEISGVKMVGYISDDCYTLKQFSLSPLFWIDRLIKRLYIKKAIDKCQILYTITELQKEEYNEIFGNKCKVLFKGGDFKDSRDEYNLNKDQITFVYSGNLGSGRWKTLSLIAKAIEKLNNEKKYSKCQLHIYSNTPLSKKAKESLQINGVSILKDSVPYNKIKKIQRDADVLIHVESFELSERYSARLSFSTKIVDYLEAGRCILAVGWHNTGGINYLMQNDAAIIVVDRLKIYSSIKELLSSNKIVEYSKKSYECGKNNHQIEKIRAKLYKDLLNLLYN